MAKHKEWKEGELVLTFGLTKKLFNDPSPLMIEWQSVEAPPFTTYEQYIFDETYAKGVAGINGWSEEDLKMKFISLILILGKLTDSGRIVTFFDKKLSGIVEGITLSVKTDFMVAKGLMDMFQTPFFHFQ
ncbi:MAG: hypothetical protein MUE30_12935, partial [Spirosomaceae bacterium]|nr:hypothetical protein [Spirosomataceae bacterium]